MIEVSSLSPDTLQQLAGGNTTPLPSREQVLLELLSDPSLAWNASRARDDVTWDSINGQDPTTALLGDLDDIGRPMRRHDSRVRNHGLQPMKGHTGIDWHTVELETLSTTTENYDIVLRKTRVNSYSHRTRVHFDNTSYSAEFSDREDKSQRVAVDGQHHPALEKLFNQIAKTL